jgi:exodeoxyribonuclease V alpha subunit
VSTYAFQRDGGEWSQEAWRALDRAVYRWVRAHGGSALLAATAAWTSLADMGGDAALPLTAENRLGMPRMSAAEIEQLRAEAMVAADDATQAHAFVLDRAQRFYFWRNYAHERDAAKLILARRTARSRDAAMGDDAYAADLDALFHDERGDDVELQREAVRGVAGRRLFVLTGGPGTGKTTTVLRMLLMLQRRARQPLSIQIAAPTGKAAQRLLQALRRGKTALCNHRSAPLPAQWAPLLHVVPDADALTVHRLLGFEPWRNMFRRNERDPIAADVVVVDEASMLDLGMLRTLLGAVRPEATLILVGDADQLTSVATGSVLMDIVAALESAESEDLVRLRHSFRAQEHLVALNEAVRMGEFPAVQAAIDSGRGDITLRTVETNRQLGEQIQRWARELASEAALRTSLPAMVPDALDPERTASTLDDAGAAAIRAERVHAALAALARRQLLCALRESDFGAVAVNAAIERMLRALWKVDAGAEWYAGRAIIVTHNDYAAGLFNGDVGLCLADEKERLQVWFEAASNRAGEAGSTLRRFSPNTLPAHETAFAITIHKSQGSEYGDVAVLLTPDVDNRILSRQLLYTAVSRARRRVELWSSAAVLQATIGRAVQRQGGLRERLLDVGQSAPKRAPKSPPTPEQNQLSLPF